MSKHISDDLIINVRDQMHWSQRMTTDVCTAVMWGGWFYLWRPVISLLAWLHGWSLIVHPVSHHHATGLAVIARGSSVLNAEGLLALLCGAGALLLWSLLPARQVKARSQVNTVADCAEYFGLSEQEIRDGRDTSVCVVHHDAEGRIVRIAPRS